MAQYDPVRRRPAVRKGRERGAWLYVPADELAAAGIALDAPPPFYRLFRRKRPGALFVQFYSEA